MSEASLLAAMFLSAQAGFLLLALSQPRNWKLVMGEAAPASRWGRRLRFGGYALLAASLGIALHRDGPSFGPILWTVSLTVAAASVVAWLTWHAPRLRPVLRALVGTLPGRRHS
ncbi:DUF3325 domain-containing protein [Phenylobacterium sp. LjRoot225]|uniref:DUF3325 domain-containing protein n=1 Tax=Phenylobacterium sp. LjRoot225 TaxID=3342285 RepID=UPI003ED0C4EA